MPSGAAMTGTATGYTRGGKSVSLLMTAVVVNVGVSVSEILTALEAFLFGGDGLLSLSPATGKDRVLFGLPFLHAGDL